jgi:nucleoside-diphosphate-sugar epimerase
VRRVAVTGAAGFIGSHLCERLLNEEIEVLGIDDLSIGSRANLQSCLGHPGFRLKVLDCSDAHELRIALGRIDAIVHLAGRKIPRYGGALKTLECNVAGTTAVCTAAHASECDLILASTSDVYGNAPSPLAEDGPLVLGPPTSRRWAYAVSKLYGEHLALGFAEDHGVGVTILRLFGSYGPRNHPSWWGGPQAAFIEALLDGKPMDIHGDGCQRRSFTYVSDTVDGILRALATPALRGEVLNIGASEPIRILDLAALVQSLLGIAPPLHARFVAYESFPGRYQDVREREPDAEKARAALGFQARVSLNEGIKRTIEWHRQNREEMGRASR